MGYKHSLCRESRFKISVLITWKTIFSFDHQNITQGKSADRQSTHNRNEASLRGNEKLIHKLGNYGVWCRQFLDHMQSF